MSEFQPTEAQLRTLGVLVDLIGLSGVHRRPEQGSAMVLDLLPGSHVISNLSALGPEPFCVRVPPDGSMHPLSDEEAGLDKRPTMLEAIREQNKATAAELERKFS